MGLSAVMFSLCIVVRWYDAYISFQLNRTISQPHHYVLEAYVKQRLFTRFPLIITASNTQKVVLGASSGWHSILIIRCKESIHSQIILRTEIRKRMCNRKNSKLSKNEATVRCDISAKRRERCCKRLG
jgi:hypothetical protein